MRILFCGDTHGFTNHVIYLLDIAKREKCDAIFQLGDFGAWEHTATGVKFFDDVSRHAISRGIPVYWLDGNHDKSSLVMERYGENRDDEGFVIVRDSLYYAPRGHRWTWNGRTFLAFGGAYSVDKGWRLEQESQNKQKQATANRYRREAKVSEADYPTTAGSLWFPEEEATDDDVRAILDADSSPVDVLLTHDKPISSAPAYNRKDWTQIPECAPNQQRVQRLVTALTPRLLLHGHLHIWYEDTIWCGDDRATKVIGLNCDDTAGRGNPGYRRDDSWLVVDVFPAGVEVDD